MGFPALKELEGKIEAKRKTLGTVFDEAGPDLDMSKVKSLDGTTAEKAAAIKQMNDELTDLGKERDGLLEVKRAAEAVADMPEAKSRGNDDGGRESKSAERKSLGEHFLESAAFKGYSKGVGPVASLDIEVKTLFQTPAWAQDIVRSDRVVPFAVVPVTAVNLFPTTTTSQSSISWMEETTYTNNAAEVAEAGTYPESALALTEKTTAVSKIATWIPVTDELFEDQPRAKSYVENRLGFMVQQRLSGQVLNGNGTAPNLRGLLNTSGIQTQAKGADPAPDAVYKAMTKIRVTGQAFPGAVVFNPTDWQNIRLLKTADGVYIWGSPADVGPDRIWGLTVAQETGLTAGTAVVGDFANFTELAMRRGLDIQITNSHSTFFVEGKQAIRADVRAALAVYRPAAFCTVTGL